MDFLGTSLKLAVLSVLSGDDVVSLVLLLPDCCELSVFVFKYFSISVIIDSFIKSNSSFSVYTEFFCLVINNWLTPLKIRFSYNNSKQ